MHICAEETYVGMALEDIHVGERRILDTRDGTADRIL